MKISGVFGVGVRAEDAEEDTITQLGCAGNMVVSPSSDSANTRSIVVSASDMSEASRSANGAAADDEEEDADADGEDDDGDEDEDGVDDDEEEADDSSAS